MTQTLDDRARRIQRNFAVLSATQTASRLLAFGVTLHLTRALGVEGFGAIAFATSLLTYAGLVADGGFRSLGQREVARGRLPLARLVPTVVVLRLSLSLAGLVLLLAFSSLARLSGTTETLVLIYGLSLIPDTMSLDWVLLGAERTGWVGSAEVVAQALLLGGVVWAVQHPDAVVRVPLIYLLSRFAAAGWLWAGFRRCCGRLATPDRALMRPLLRDALPLLGTAAAGMLSHNFDLVLLGVWLGQEATGLYGAAYRIAWLPLSLATAYYSVLRPTLSHGFVAGFETIRGVLDRSFRLATALAVGLAAGGALVAAPLLAWLYGAGYSRASPALQGLLVGTALVIVNRHFRALLVAFGRERAALATMASGGAVNVVLNLLLIPRWGIAGAAFATACSETVILLLGGYSTRALVAPLAVSRHLPRPLLCALPMSALLALTPSWPVLLRITLGGVVYLISLISLRVVSGREIASLASAWLPRRSGTGGESA